VVGRFAARSIDRKVSTRNRASAGLDEGGLGLLFRGGFRLHGYFVTLATIVEAFSWMKDFAIDVLVRFTIVLP